MRPRPPARPAPLQPRSDPGPRRADRPVGAVRPPDRRGVSGVRRLGSARGARIDSAVGRRRRHRRWWLAAYPALLVVLTLVQVVAPQRSGPLALSQVFAPWLFLPLLFLLPFALAPRAHRRSSRTRWRCWRSPPTSARTSSRRRDPRRRRTPSRSGSPPGTC